jgi:hypothetical protein
MRLCARPFVARHYDARPMATVELTDDELTLLRNALHSFLDDFGHKEQDLLDRIQALIAKLPAEDGSAEHPA